jgi:DNA mismatch endonuclease (patch repair protein)
MRANRKTGSRPEVRLRSELHRRGLRFRKNVRIQLGDVSATADIVFRRHRVAVFVDGCFWHACPQHGVRPHANARYWERKLQANVTRDRLVTAAFQERGWRVIRIWEHVPAEQAAAMIVSILSRLTEGPPVRNTRVAG